MTSEIKRVNGEEFLRLAQYGEKTIRHTENAEIELTVRSSVYRDQLGKFIFEPKVYYGPDPATTSPEDFLVFLGYVATVPEFGKFVYEVLAQKMRVLLEMLGS